MEKLVKHASSYRYGASGGGRPVTVIHPTYFPYDDFLWSFRIDELQHNGRDHGFTEPSDANKKETAVLIAAKNGIVEMVEEILTQIPDAIYDANIDGKNIVLLAVENRQPIVYRLLTWRFINLKEIIFSKTDKNGNNALHLASMLRSYHLPSYLPGPVFKIQCAVKWYEFVMRSMPDDFFQQYNIEGLTPEEIFIEEHRELVEEASAWLKQTSQSWSVVASLIATVAFTSSTAIPGGLKQEGGIPALGKDLAFSVFGISALVALCFSVISILMFLAFFTSSDHVMDFNVVLPRKLLVGLGSVFLSLVAMLVSFCSAHFLIMRDQLKYTAGGSRKSR